MAPPSQPASNGIIYTTYAVFLMAGLYIAWTLRKQTKGEYLATLRTQKGIDDAPSQFEVCADSWARPIKRISADHFIVRSTGIPLALNFIASGECTRRAALA
ncbi:hypothetical protein PV10_03493 [Exophiala mesophila]|uniref:Uncharacterized protein n=1 Tax=Exophiala mesophila TaxID=212818 RepID=A0A0D1ZMM2_EXOME|nr:uncharacterized protein PV10_03493 [Exophiala mesophila]KIV95892.1 hypothetical protein PV10_03493 [Exophiala mesophila]